MTDRLNVRRRVETVLVVLGILVLLISFGHFGTVAVSGRVVVVTATNECNVDFDIEGFGGGICILRSHLTTEQCDSSNFTIRQGSCAGNFICNNDLKFDITKTTCAWAIPSGTYNYVLCDGDTPLLTKPITCQ